MCAMRRFVIVLELTDHGQPWLDTANVYRLTSCAKVEGFLNERLGERDTPQYSWSCKYLEELSS